METFTAPANWASAIIGSDRSGLAANELAELNAYLAANPEHAAPVDCGDSYVGQFAGLTRMVCDYSLGE